MNNSYVIGYTDSLKIITTFSSLSFIYDNDNEYIQYFGTQSGDTVNSLESIDNLTIKISDLKCKSYEELLVQMDVHNLLHGMEIPDEICTTDTKIDNVLKNKVKVLTKENMQLKLKLKQLKNLLDK